ncbi:hypothetical protein [Eubacterium sp.]|uniref:hypothetical protein n=1 Tax=Eubacterium sp. TaxID=142586 RepID=UPI0039917D1A
MQKESKKDWRNRLAARIRQAMEKVKKYVTENKKATKSVGQVGFHQNGVPIELQQSGYIGNISRSGCSVNIQGKPFSAENTRGQTKKTVI